MSLINHLCMMGQVRESGARGSPLFVPQLLNMEESEETAPPFPRSLLPNLTCQEAGSKPSSASQEPRTHPFRKCYRRRPGDSAVNTMSLSHGIDFQTIPHASFCRKTADSPLLVMVGTRPCSAGTSPTVGDSVLRAG